MYTKVSKDLQQIFLQEMNNGCGLCSNIYRHCHSGHNVNFCSDLPRRASEIQFSLALLELALALEKLYKIVL